MSHILNELNNKINEKNILKKEIQTLKSGMFGKFVEPSGLRRSKDKLSMDHSNPFLVDNYIMNISKNIKTSSLSPTEESIIYTRTQKQNPNIKNQLNMFG